MLMLLRSLTNVLHSPGKLCLCLQNACKVSLGNAFASNFFFASERKVAKTLKQSCH